MLLQAENVSVQRRGNWLLKDVSCHIQAGRVLAILGPNGAGKSTLLRLLSGEIRPNGGSIHFDGKPLSQWAPEIIAKRRAVLSQQNPLQFPFRAEEVVALGRMPHGDTAATTRQIVQDALKQADIADFAERSYPTLSGGERQRIQWARILTQIWPVHENDCLLLDEPTTYLDLSHQHALLEQARNCALKGAAVVAVLHDLSQAWLYSDDILILHHGEVAAFGPKEQCFTPEIIEKVFGMRCAWVPCPISQKPVLITLP